MQKVYRFLRRDVSLTKMAQNDVWFDVEMPRYKGRNAKRRIFYRDFSRLVEVCKLVCKSRVKTKEGFIISDA